MAASLQRENPAPLWLIAAAMLAGVIFGVLGQMRMPIEERLLDGSLVLSGQVTYPAGAVLDLYYKGMWTILYQLGALVLKAGVSYATANYIFLLLPPAILTGAFALFIHGLTGRPLFALVAAILCFMNGHLVSLFASSDYPLLGMAWNTPSQHSYGRFAGVLSAFALAALVGGRDGLAAFTAAVLVAVHPVIGAYTATMLALGLAAAHLAWGRPISRRLLLGFAAGVAITLISFAVYLVLRPTMPVVDEATNRALVEFYSSFWDDHRNKPATRSDFYRVVILFAITAVPLLVFLVARSGRRTAADAGALALLAAIVLSTVLYVMVHWARAFLPDIVVRTIPGRLINLQACFVMALAIGMVVFLSDEIARRLSSNGAVAILFRYPNAIAAAVAVVLMVRFLPGFTYMVATAPGDPDVQAFQQELKEIDSPFWTKVRALKINRLVLVPPEISLTAMRYGRLPIALESAIDFIPYLPRTATKLADLIERGYGVSFLHPPSIMQFGGILPPGTGRDYWACLSPAQWQKVAQEFDAGAILVPADWPVRLPVLLSDSKYALYEMPTDKLAPANAPTETPCPLWRG